MNDSGSTYKHTLKMAKWFFTIAVLLFVAKPFIGFALNPSNSSIQLSILVKSFTKRKQEFVEGGKFDIKTIQKKLAEPVSALFLLFSCLLSIIYPLIAESFNVTGNFIRRIKLSLFPSPDTWLLNGQFII